MFTIIFCEFHSVFDQPEARATLIYKYVLCWFLSFLINFPSFFYTIKDNHGRNYSWKYQSGKNSSTRFKDKNSDKMKNITKKPNFMFYFV